MKPEFLKFKSYLSSISNIEEQEFNLAIPHFDIKKIKKGEKFIQEGNHCNHIAFIVDGLFRIYLSKKGEELNTCFCLENSIISSFESFARGVPAQENIEALEDSKIITLSFKNIEKLSEQSKTMKQLRTFLTEQECLRLASRLNEMSFKTALEKYKNLMTNEPQIIQRVSNFHIASYLGITKETLSRIRAKIRL